MTKKEEQYRRRNASVLVSSGIGNVSTEIIEPENMRTMMVLAHGAGAGMNHAFMVKLALELAAASIGTIRYNFPYMENGKKRPDPPAIAHKAVEQVIAFAAQEFPNTPLLAAGKSFGGRMSSQFLSANATSKIKGIVFYGFPLHPAGKPSVDRAEHLKNITLPMLFLQGTKDTLAELPLIQSTCASLSTATLITFEGADHGFKVAKRGEIIPELVEETVKWMTRVAS